jgi:hypothetical protein
MKLLHDLFLFLAVRRIEEDVYSGKIVHQIVDDAGYPYYGFDFNWCGHKYLCEWMYGKDSRDRSVLDTVIHEMNKQKMLTGKGG